MSQSENKNIFIVHGHDDNFKNEVYNFLLQNYSLKTIVLHEVPNRGRTIIEKLEDVSNDAVFAIILLSPDDEFGITSRARQNVVFECGYFYGKIGRQKVCILKKGEVEELSDLDGIVYISIDGQWKYELQKELAEAGVAQICNY